MDLDADFDFIKAAGVVIIGGVIAAFFIWGFNSTVGKKLAYFGPTARTV